MHKYQRIMLRVVGASDYELKHKYADCSSSEINGIFITGITILIVLSLLLYYFVVVKLP